MKKTVDELKKMLQYSIKSNNFNNSQGTANVMEKGSYLVFKLCHGVSFFAFLVGGNFNDR